jgi:uncharacterized protein (DUF885 family)
MYDDNPLGRISWLKRQMFRAGRCIVDNVMHTMGWSQEKAAVPTLGISRAMRWATPSVEQG